MKFAIIILLCNFILSAAQVQINGVNASVNATSTLKSSKSPGRYDVKNIFDGDSTTAWVEGNNGISGTHTINITFDKEVIIDAILFNPGYCKSAKLFEANATPKNISFKFDQSKYSGSIPYDMEFSYEAPAPRDTVEDCLHTSNQINLSKRVIFFKSRISTKQMTIDIDASLMGSKYADMALSDVVFVGSSFSNDAAITNLIETVRMQKVSSALDYNKMKIVRSEVLFYKNYIQVKAPPLPDSIYMITPIYETNTRGKEFLIEQVSNNFFERVLTIVPNGNAFDIVGPKIKSNGDSEWLEVYPVITIDKSGIVQYSHRYHGDGAPGCSDVLPKRSR